MIIPITKKEDLPACLHIIHKSFQTVADEFGLTMENCPKHTSFLPLSYLTTQMDWGWHMFGFVYEHKLVGYMSLSKESDSVYELHHLAVLPEYRHNGFGKNLLEHAKKTVYDLGGNAITLGIIEESTLLRNYYEVNGFVHTGTQKFPHLPFTCGYLTCSVP